MPHPVTDITLPSLSRLLIVIFCLHHIPSAQVLAQDGDGACDVPSVEPLASTSLTCHFNEDLNQTKRRFHVFLNAQHVLGCQWISGNMVCYVSPGYRFNYAVSRNVILEIPRASVEQIGTYTCVLDNNPERKSCDFRLTLSGKTMCDVPSVTLNTPTSLTCYFPKDIGKTKEDFTVYHYRNSGRRDQVLSNRRTKNSQSIIPGYKLDGNVTDHLTVRIPSAVEDQEGNYSCHIEGVVHQNCSFILQNVASMTSTCNIPSVQETKPAELTCAFNVDVNVTRKNFKVVHNGGEEIVSCRWRNNELSCSKSRGYEINKTVTDHFVIKVTAASSEHKGKYVCQLMDAKMDCFEPCEFNVLMTAGSTGDHDKTATVGVPLLLAICAATFVSLVGIVLVLWFCYFKKRTESVNMSSDDKKNNTKQDSRKGLLENTHGAT